jgi:hypothetical protein
MYFPFEVGGEEEAATVVGEGSFGVLAGVEELAGRGRLDELGLKEPPGELSAGRRGRKKSEAPYWRGKRRGSTVTAWLFRRRGSKSKISKLAAKNSGKGALANNSVRKREDQRTRISDNFQTRKSIGREDTLRFMSMHK